MLSKEFFDYLSVSIGHHDLVIIENALACYRFFKDKDYLDHVHKLDELRQSYEKDPDSYSESTIQFAMRDACHAYDVVSEIDSLVNRLFYDRRRSDFNNRKYADS